MNEKTNGKETVPGLEDGKFYAYVSRMKYIMRWGLMRNTERENIQEHSLQVAILAHALCLIRNELFAGEEGYEPLSPEKACLYGVFHDCDEIITGDLPTPIKYANPVIRDNYHDIEAQSREKMLAMLPDKLKPVYREILFFETDAPEYRPIVKGADRLSAYIKCEEECKAGNTEFSSAKKIVLKSLRDMDRPELNYFMDHYLGAFSQTLDELERGGK